MIAVFLWFTSLSIVISRSTHIAANGIISSFFLWLSNSPDELPILKESSYNPKSVIPCGRPHHGPQRCARSNPLNLWISYLARVEGIKVAERIKVANQVILRLGGCLGLSGWAQCNQKGPSNREERSRGAHVRAIQWEKDWTGYRWKATMSWGVWAALEAGKMQGKGFPPRASRREHSPADILVLAQGNSFWTLTSKTVRESIYVTSGNPVCSNSLQQT